MNPGFEIPKAYTTRKTFFMEKYFFNLKFAHFMGTYDHGIPQDCGRSWVK